MSRSCPSLRRASHESAAQNRRFHPRPAPAGVVPGKDRALPRPRRGHQQRANLFRPGHPALHRSGARPSLESGRNPGRQLGLRSPPGAAVHPLHARRRVPHAGKASPSLDRADHRHVSRRFLGQPRAPVGLDPPRHAGLGRGRPAGGAAHLCFAPASSATDSCASSRRGGWSFRPWLDRRSGERSMTSALHLLLLAWLVAAGGMALLWLLHLPMRNAAIVDFGWAFLLPTLAILYAVLGPGYALRRGLMAGLASLWGYRLAFYLLFTRILGHAEEGRYVELRRSWKTQLPFKFFIFFQAQAILNLLLSLPFLLTALN